MKIKATDPKSETSVEVSYDLGENLGDATNKFGEEVIFSYYKQKAVITLQAFVRGKVRAGLNQEQIQTALDTYKLGVVQRSHKDPKEKLMKMFAGMSSEEQKEFLKALKGQK